MNNPFDIIDKRLSNIEDLLLDLKHSPKEAKKDNTDPQDKNQLKSLNKKKYIIKKEVESE